MKEECWKKTHRRIKASTNYGDVLPGQEVRCFPDRNIEKHDMDQTIHEVTDFVASNVLHSYLWLNDFSRSYDLKSTRGYYVNDT